MIRSQRGLTLVELVIAIVVVSIAVTSIMGVLATVGGRSADPIVFMQAQAIAESYLDEINSKAFVYPDPGPVCKTPPALRSDYTAICDFRGLPDTVVRNAQGAAIAELSGYSVSVAITENMGADFTPALPVADAVKIVVTVTSANDDYNITNYRTRY